MRLVLRRRIFLSSSITWPVGNITPADLCLSVYRAYFNTYYTMYTMLCYAMLCYAMLCYAMLCYAMLCYAMLCYAMLCYAMLCYAMLCYAMLCYDSIEYAMLCYAMLCYAMLCYAMLCYAMLCYMTILKQHCDMVVLSQATFKNQYFRKTNTLFLIAYFHSPSATLVIFQSCHIFCFN